MMNMENITLCSGDVNNIVTQSYLDELLDQVIALKASLSEKECAKSEAYAELDSLMAKIQQTIETAVQLKSKHILCPKQINKEPPRQNKLKGTQGFKEHFIRLQLVLGVTINCSPSKKIFEVLFHDAHKSKVLFSYNEKGIEIEEIHPSHENFDAIREHLRETGDLLGFLTVFGRRITQA